ncbi:MULTISPECIES: class I SAM-dependent methyltransferase [unclassified Mucilaginibacter]|uniref:class I SAM-dependent methyltransferase n=1 Tax=unclassified Mucilaginibacter TaxID=2617802 RepID=UPI002AC9ADA3|nr:MULTISPECIES: class I SAM-dependent methyltransferase [unclassified Mucilaginibacter]MEB0260040.1 class I SAM-dependent methyltransferase [Mucilaginibacter sp. 10I4]MEB0280545.1 class I SAM-dependent methyltransferase [Mucilaginibacter sp. 10B2]MEB0301115.1 class I SAM-dependent methyltransferase [Mucilaginibacter sp. 5C4]WPX22423.1 class I SAM-dependent methyltransferase [Mucilaginibacter sp. 5C4]
METDTLNFYLFRKDASFDYLYPDHIKELSQMHWTPIDIAKKAAFFLAIPNARVLDIGSGVGKFCITAGAHFPKTQFIGIEQRKELCNYAEIAREEIGLDNVNFIHGNLTDLDYDDYDHFYFYNSFYENIEPGSRIDYAVRTSFELYERYSRFVYAMLVAKKSGTRLVTYHARETQIPSSYNLVDNNYNSLLKMWIKK